MVKVLVAAISAVLAGCGYGASFRDCAINCSSESGCPSGFTCGAEGLCRSLGAMTTCGAGLDASGDGNEGSGNAMDGGDGGGGGDGGDVDTDGDGIPDSMDNCRFVANPDQANEDGDRFGDVCDPCPPYYDSDPTVDSDGDGVSDACDPRPTISGDRIFLFEGFHSGIPAGWQVTGTWTGSGDALVVNNTSATVASLSTSAPTSGHETISTSVTLVAAADASQVATVDDDHLASDTATICRVIYSNTTPELQLADNNVTGGLARTVPYSSQIGSTYIVTERRDLQTFDCAVARVGDPDTDTGSGSSVIDNASPQIGLHVFDMTTATFQWVMVVTNQ